jgi:hypothetical protein
VVPHIKRTIRRMRGKAEGSLIVPTSKEQVNLPSRFMKTVNDEDFLLFDSGLSSDRIMLFSTSKNLEFLQLLKVWLVDGTFHSCPTIFDQIFVIHGWHSGTCFPLVYVFCPNCTIHTYDRIQV